MKDLRAAGERHEQLPEALCAALTPFFDMLHGRFEKLSVKGTPIERGEPGTKDEAKENYEKAASVLFCEEVPAFGSLKRAHLEQARAKRFFDTPSFDRSLPQSDTSSSD